MGFGSIGKISYYFLTMMPKWKELAKDYTIEILCPEDITLPINHKHHKIKLTKENYKDELDSILKGKGNILWNVTNRVSSIDLIHLAILREWHYMDTSLETWIDDIYNYKQPKTDKQIINKSIQKYQQKLAEDIENMTVKSFIGCQVGCNPGLYDAYFVRKAIMNLYKYFYPKESQEISIAEMAQKCNVYVIQNAEYDDQEIKNNILSKMPKDNFINTWSCWSYIDECITAESELGFGTHEKNIPSNSILYNHQLILKQKPCNTVRETYIPYIGKLKGYVVPHSDSSYLALYLEISDDKTRKINSKITNSNKNKIVKYRPTTYYCYHSCPNSIMSINDIKDNHYTIPEYLYVMNASDCTKKTSTDYMTALLLGKNPQTREKYAYSCGSLLSNQYLYEIGAQEWGNATGVQVIACLLVCLLEITKYKSKGIYYSLDIPYEHFNVIDELLGEIYEDFVDYKPHSFNFFEE